MDALEHELAELRAATEAEVLSTRASAAADIQQALLFKGDDFGHTDITPALPAPDASPT